MNADDYDVPSDEDFDAQCWNEVCDDLDCDDTNYHATIDELMERIRHNSNEIEVLGEAEDIVFQAGCGDNDGDDDAS